MQGDEIVVQRAFPLGKETVKCTVPCLLTVVDSANQPRPPSVHRIIARKLAATPLEYAALLEKWSEFETEEALDSYLAERGLKIPIWTIADVDADAGKVGLSGSPTKVLKIESVVLETSESKQVSANSEGISVLIQELVQDYIV